jgi:Domain of unknown function (DUF4136)
LNLKTPFTCLTESLEDKYVTTDMTAKGHTLQDAARHRMSGARVPRGNTFPTLEQIPKQHIGNLIILTRRLTFLPAFLFIIACAYGQDVHYNYDHGADFTSFKTYQWVDASANAPNVPAGTANLPSAPPPPPPGLPPIPGGLPNLPGGAPTVRGSGTEDQLLDQDIKRAVDAQLVQKGLMRVEKNGDLQVSYQAALHSELSLNLFGSGWGGRGSGFWDSSVQGQTSAVPIGTLVVGLYDPARKQLIWRGDASKTIDLKRDPDKNYKTLQKAMAKLFENYPPGHKK